MKDIQKAISKLKLATSLKGKKTSKVLILDKIFKETDKAVAFQFSASMKFVNMTSHGDTKTILVWMPKSQIEILEFGILVPLWLIKEKYIEQQPKLFSFELVFKGNKDKKGESHAIEINQKVEHVKFGKGIVTERDSQRIGVDFNGDFKYLMVEYVNSTILKLI